MKRVLHFFSLFGSTATLICCALPALFVVLGFGATVGSLLSSFPQLIWLSEHKILVFVISGFMILTSHFLQIFMKPIECPIDEKAESCKTTRSSSKVILWIATLIWLIGFSFAYVLPLVM